MGGNAINSNVRTDVYVELRIEAPHQPIDLPVPRHQQELEVNIPDSTSHSRRENLNNVQNEHSDVLNHAPANQTLDDFGPLDLSLHIITNNQINDSRHFHKNRPSISRTELSDPPLTVHSHQDYECIDLSGRSNPLSHPVLSRQPLGDIGNLNFFQPRRQNWLGNYNDY